MNGAATLVLPIERGESKTPSSYDKIAICVSFFSRRPHAAPDRLCDPRMTHARSCGAFGAYRAKVLTCGITRPRPVGSVDAGGGRGADVGLRVELSNRCTYKAGANVAKAVTFTRAGDGEVDTEVADIVASSPG